MSWVLTCTGREHDLTPAGHHNPANAPSLSEIAHSLAQINRFTGHCVRPYSVAEHSLLVCRIAAHHGADYNLQFAALMHDAHECITGDVASPIKQVLGKAWADFEAAQQLIVARRFGLVYINCSYELFIKTCDLIALATERRDLMPFDAKTHKPWPVLDTEGGEIVPFKSKSLGIFLHKINPAHNDWNYWADEFKYKAQDLLSKMSIPAAMHRKTTP